MRAFFSYGFVLQLIALIHFMRRRPDGYWVWIIFLGGPVGAIAYLFVEMVPDLGLFGPSFKGFSRRRRIHLLRAIVLENPAAGNYEELGDLLLEEKRYAKAREAYDHALSSRTDSIDPFYRRGIAAFEMGDYTAALPDLEHVVKANPKYDYSRAQLFYARTLASVDRPEEASAAFQRLLDSSTANEALCIAAEFFAAHDRKAEAKELAERILARRATMPAYQKRRDRPWIRRAAALKRQLSAVKR